MTLRILDETYICQLDAWDIEGFASSTERQPLDTRKQEVWPLKVYINVEKFWGEISSPRRPLEGYF